MEKDKSLGEIRVEVKAGSKDFKIETGKLSGLTSGSSVVRVGDSVVLANVVIADEPDEEKDFFPLIVDFEDKWYATGRISGSRFVKREGRPSELAVLRSRMIDRSIRPMFPDGYRNDAQVVVTPLSLDDSIDPAVIGLNAASQALMLTNAPFEGPIGAVRVGYIDSKFVINPTGEEAKNSSLDLFLAGTEESITMIESGANELGEETFIEAIKKGHDEIKKLANAQKKLRKEVGIKEAKSKEEKEANKAYDAVTAHLKGKLGKAIIHQDKTERKHILADLEDLVLEEFKEDFEKEEIKSAFDKAIKEEVRRSILEEGKRPDGRGVDDIREISCETGVLPRTHGSGLFQRGETQVLSLTTLASPSKKMTVDSMDQDFEKAFMHHYSDAPYSYGDIGRLGPGRRAIGHGFLAEKALEPLIPDENDFPYTTRVVSEILSCNGSSSMGSVCGASLSLMDAGVPIKKHVAGIAMGLITEDGSLDNNYEILTDIQGAEDFSGDMDFKCAGTRDGITALQLDIKVKGLTIEFIAKVLKKARKAHDVLLDKMEKEISEPRKAVSKYAPRLTTISVNPEKIRDVIGKGGETINKIIEETGVEIDIEDDGNIVIASENKEDAKKAIDWIDLLTQEPEVGKIYEGKVVKIMDFGAFVEFMPGHQGLVHISELDDQRVEKTEDVVKEGDKVDVKLIGIDSQGRYNLSKKKAKK